MKSLKKWIAKKLWQWDCISFFEYFTYCGQLDGTVKKVREGYYTYHPDGK